MGEFTSSLKLYILLLMCAFAYTAKSQDKINPDYPGDAKNETVAETDISEMEVAHLKNALISGLVFLIDVRTPEETQAGMISGALNIPYDLLESRITQEETWKDTGKKLPGKTDPVVVYCSSGIRGAIAAKILIQLGYTNVRSLNGGLSAWLESLSCSNETQ